MAGKAGPRVMRRGGTAGPDAREQPLHSRCSYYESSGYESSGYESDRSGYTCENPARGAAPRARVAPARGAALDAQPGVPWLTRRASRPPHAAGGSMRAPQSSASMRAHLMNPSHSKPRTARHASPCRADTRAHRCQCRPASLCRCKPASLCRCRPASLCRCKPASLCQCKPASLCRCKPASLCRCKPHTHRTRAT
jgi:hypothetical protein